MVRNMLKINFLLKFVFLGLLVKFGNVSCASFEEEESKVAFHGDGASDVNAVVRLSSLSDDMSIGDLLSNLSDMVCGNDCVPTRENLANHRRVANSLVKNVIATLNYIRDPAAQEFLLIVGRLVNFWLLDIGIPVSSNWLSFVVDENGQRLSKADALKYLIGDDGVVSSALNSIRKKEAIIDSRRGTNIFRLSEMFFEAAKNFDAALNIDREFRLAQCTYLDRACNGTVFSEQDLYLFNVLDEALICSATAQQLAGGDIARRVDRLEDNRADDAQRIAKLEGQMGIVLKDRDSFFQPPITFIVSIAFFRPFKPFTFGLIGAADYVCPGYIKEPFKWVVMGVPLLGRAISYNLRSM